MGTYNTNWFYYHSSLQRILEIYISDSEMLDMWLMERDSG